MEKTTGTKKQKLTITAKALLLVLLMEISVIFFTDVFISIRKYQEAKARHIETKVMVENIIRAVKPANAVVTVLLVTLMLLLFIYMRRKILNPILKMNTSVKDMVNKLDNDETISLDIKTGDELEALSNSLNDMNSELRDYIRRLSTLTAERERVGVELNAATRMQAQMLPCKFPAFPERSDIEIYASMTPAKEVGGDFYDFFLLDDDHLAMVMADVSGKGIPAALFMVISKTLLKAQTQLCRSPKTILEEVNAKLYESNAEGMFVTVWLGIMEISTGKIVAANAGHEYPAIKKAEGCFEIIKDKHGMVLGAMPGLKYKEYELELEKGGCLFLYTDGVPEATNADNKLFGMDRMLEALNEDPEADPEKILSHVKDATDRFVKEAPQFDDLTMLAVRLT